MTAEHIAYFRSEFLALMHRNEATARFDMDLDALVIDFADGTMIELPQAGLPQRIFASNGYSMSDALVRSAARRVPPAKQ